MIDDVVEVDVDDVDVDEDEDVVDEGLEGSKRKYLCHAGLVADISLFLMTTSLASM